MEFFHEGRGVFMAASRALMERVGATENDAEDLSQLAGIIEGVDCGAVLRELGPNQWKLSLRGQRPGERHGGMPPPGRRRPRHGGGGHPGGGAAGGQGEDFAGHRPG